MPLVSFCISTYKRPQILLNQLQLLIQQTYPDFEVVISDNDPDESAKIICGSLQDLRIKYFTNKENLGMIKSFNKSIQRANSDFIVMITDDDPLEINFLSEMVPLINEFPDKSLYCGFKRKNDDHNKIEIITPENFPSEVLHPEKNPSIFWSNCILRKSDIIKIGLIPDYGSPHLADHALLALCGAVSGAVIKNKIYSSHNLHENNYSRSNFDSYYKGCIGFYNLLSTDFKGHSNSKEIERTIKLHLKVWFISMSFSLRKYFYKLQDKKKLEEINDFSKKILELDFMKKSILKYKAKRIIFDIKALLGML